MAKKDKVEKKAEVVVEQKLNEKKPIGLSKVTRIS